MKAGIGDWGFGIREASACVELSSCGHRVGPGPPELDACLGVACVRRPETRAVRVYRHRSSARSLTGIKAGIGDWGLGIREASACVELSSCGRRVGPGPPELDAGLGVACVRRTEAPAVRVCRHRSSARSLTRIGGHGGPGPTLCACGASPTFGNPESRIPNPDLPRQRQRHGNGGSRPTLCGCEGLLSFDNPESRIPNPDLPRQRQRHGNGGSRPTLCGCEGLLSFDDPESPIPNPVLPPKRQDPREARTP
jgi:hypothetical protein